MLDVGLIDAVTKGDWNGVRLGICDRLVSVVR